MCKFNGKDAPGFRTVVAALKRYALDAPPVIGERNRVARQELGAKGWCEARELVGGIQGGGFSQGIDGVGDGGYQEYRGGVGMLGKTTADIDGGGADGGR